MKIMREIHKSQNLFIEKNKMGKNINDFPFVPVLKYLKIYIFSLMSFLYHHNNNDNYDVQLWMVAGGDFSFEIFLENRDFMRFNQHVN